MFDFENAKKEGEWKGNPDDTNLFYFWQNLKEENVIDITEEVHATQFDEEVVAVDNEDNVEIANSENIPGPSNWDFITVNSNAFKIDREFNDVDDNVSVVKDNHAAGSLKDLIVVTINPNVCEYKAMDDVIMIEDDDEMISFSEFNFNISDFNVSATDIDLSFLQDQPPNKEVNVLKSNELVPSEKDNNDNNKLEAVYERTTDIVEKDTSKSEISLSDQWKGTTKMNEKKKNGEHDNQENGNEAEANNDKENIGSNNNENNTSNGFVEDNTPQKTEASAKTNVPTPFKKHLFWEPPLDEKKSKTRKPKEKIPAVVTSEVWQKYQEQKQEKKIKEMKEKEERKQKRIEKQKEKVNKQITKKPNGKNSKYFKNEQAKALNSEIGDFVVVNYEDKIFPGVIISVDKENKDFKVKCMEKEGSFWKWPKKDDILIYPKEHIVCAIQNPKLINETKGIYEVPDMPKEFIKLFSK